MTKPTTRPRVKPCVDCPTLITKNATRCKACAVHRINADPDLRAKRGASVKRFFRENPGKASENARKSAATRMATPDGIQRAREAMLAAQVLSWTPEAMAKRDHKGRRAKAEARRMAWCPKEYRPLYYRLMKSRDIRMTDAVAMVREQIAADAKRAKVTPIRAPEPALSPFERQERALQQGARIVANVRFG